MEDVLFETSYRYKRHQQPPTINYLCTHFEDKVCDEALTSDCRELRYEGKLRRRDRLSEDNPSPIMHISIIVSADTVMKSGEHRDTLAKKEGIIGLRMEGARI